MKRPEDMSRDELVALVRDLIGPELEPMPVVSVALGLTRIQGRIVDLLYRSPVPLTSYGAMKVVARCPEGDLDSLFKVHVCHLRKKLGPDVIETVWGRGYQLTEQGRRIVLDAIARSEREAA